MINKITLESFKAFAEKVEFLLEDTAIHGKNLLAYGENGSGKSSLYEALRLFFYQDRLLQDQLKLEGKAGEVAEADTQNFLRRYNNKKTGKDFTLTLNDQPRDTFPLNDHACYMLGNQDVQLGETLLALNYLQDLTLPAMDVAAFWEANKDTLIRNVNKAIENDFKERFTIAIADTYSTIRIEDPTRGISPEKDYRKFLNEAKLHLVALLLFFEAVKLHQATLKHGIDKLLVLDDIVTSLDATNRIFLVNYLIRNFADCQIILLTHNVSFFNQVVYKISKAVEDIEDRWELYNICEVGSGSDIYCYEKLETSGAILNQYEQDHDGDAAGNKIRKGFEAVMYEYAKIIQIDQLEESHHLISRLVEEHKPVFVKKATKKNYLWSSELVDEILTILGEPKTDTDKVTEIRLHIADYQRDTDLQKVVDLLKEMKMFQKVVLHQLSHGTRTRATFSDKEIRHSIVLLGRFEALVNQLKEKDPYGM